MRDDCIDFELAGEKLHGAWTLTRTGSDAGGDDANWLLIKRTDRGESTLEPDDEHSVPTGRTMAQIELGEETVTEDVGTDLGAIEGAKRANPPAEPALQLASLTNEAPAGDGWIHEIKYDGYRVLAHMEDGQVQLLTRNGHDWTDRFAEIAGALGRLPVRLARLDGEVVALRPCGVSSFQALQEALASGDTARLRYQDFDVLHLDDHGGRDAPTLVKPVWLASSLPCWVMRAVANAQWVIQEWVEMARELGRPIPEPRGRLMFA